MKLIRKPSLFAITLVLTFIICAYSEETKNMEKVARASRSTSTDNYGLAGFVLGPILFILSFVGIWFNEKRAAVNYNRLKLVQKLLSQQSTPREYNLQNINSQLNNPLIPSSPLLSQNRLLHKTAPSQIQQSASDSQCLIFPPDAIVIKRNVQVKQMRSYTKRRSNQDQIQYRLQWVTSNIQQCQAEFNAPTRWFVRPNTFYAPRVKVGAYYLCQSQMSQLQCQSEINPSPETISALTKMAQQSQNPSQTIIFNNYIYFPATNGDVQSRGTLRVKFNYCKSTQLSLICGVNEQTLLYQPFHIDLVDNGGHQDQLPCGGQDAQCCICCQKLAQALKPMTQINLIMKGNYDSPEMIRLSVRKNTTETNLLRLLFFCIMVIGICAFFSPFTQVLGYLPLVGGFLKGTAAIIIFLAAIIVSIPLFLITFSLGWMRYHPKVGGAIIGASVLALVLMSTIHVK